MRQGVDPWEKSLKIVRKDLDVTDLHLVWGSENVSCHLQRKKVQCMSSALALVYHFSVTMEKAPILNACLSWFISGLRMGRERWDDLNRSGWWGLQREAEYNRGMSRLPRTSWNSRGSKYVFNYKFSLLLRMSHLYTMKYDHLHLPDFCPPTPPLFSQHFPLNFMSFPTFPFFILFW